MLTPSTQARLGWIVISFFFAGSVLSYVDRAVLGVVMPQVRKDLSVTNTQYSLAINSFLILYMIFYVLGGQLADRLGSRRTFSRKMPSSKRLSSSNGVAMAVHTPCKFSRVSRSDIS